MSAKPVLMRLSEIPPGTLADCFALLADRTLGTTREGKPYYNCRFADLRRTVSLMVWGDDVRFPQAQDEWQVGGFYKLRVRYAEHEKYGPQIELVNLRPAKPGEPGFDPAQLVECSPFDPEHLLGELRTVATKHIADKPLRGLVLALLETHAESLLRLPASRDRAFAYRGGWLEHTVNVVRISLDLAERYSLHYPDLHPPLNKELVAAAAILHDIGRVLEFGDGSPIPGITAEGKLAGNLLLGRDLVRDEAVKHPQLNPEVLMLLEHLMLTSLYPSDGPGPRWPMVPEGLIVQYADDLDTKMAQYVRLLARDTTAGAFTEREPVLGRQLFKGRTV